MLTLFADLTPAAAVSLAISVTATALVPWLLLIDAEQWAWPNLRPLVENRASDRLTVAAANARHALRETALTASTAPKGGTR